MELYSTTTTTMEFHSTTMDQDLQATEGARGSTITCEEGGTTYTTAMELRMGEGGSFWGMGEEAMALATHQMDLAGQ